MYATVKRWAGHFEMGKDNHEDDDRTTATATTEENIAHVHRVMMDDRCLTERVENILHNELEMLKVSAIWVLGLLMPDLRLTRLTLSQANLAIF